MSEDLERLEPGALKIVGQCLGVQPAESLVVLADWPNERVGKALCMAAKSRGAEVSLCLMEPRSAHGEDPPRALSTTVSNADAAVFATTFSLSNSEARRQGTRAGTRIISLPGCREQTLISGAIQADFQRMAPLIKKIGRILSTGRVMEISSSAGSRLKIRLGTAESVDQTATAREPGQWAPAPNIETAIGPELEGVSGILVVDGVLIPGGVPTTPVRVEIRQGRIVGIEGGREAREFESYLNGFNDSSMFQAVEVGIGLNPFSRIGLGLMAEDESKFGTVHLGFGEGRTFGVANPAPAHVDLVIRRPTVKVDGVLIVQDEELAEHLKDKEVV